MSRPMRDWNLDCKVYVGDLAPGCAKQDLEAKFSKYGNLVNVWVARKPSGFAFVEFEDHRDADDAVRGLDGTRIQGNKIKVEMSTGKSRWGHNGPPGGKRRAGGGGGGNYYRNNYPGGFGGQSSSRGMGGAGGSRRRYRSRSYSPKKRSRSRSLSDSPKRRRRSRSRS